MGYVKGYGIDWNKIMKLLETHDFTDPRIDRIAFEVLKLTDRETHWICVGERLSDEAEISPNDKAETSISGKAEMTANDEAEMKLNDKPGMSVISFGEEAFGNDLEELRKKDIPVPEYLQKMESVLYGPDVFKFTCW